MRFPQTSIRFEMKSISMVKHSCSFMNQTTILDFLKSYSPKVRDDPFGSSSPRIASDFSDRSDLRGAAPYSPVFTLLKPCIASSVLDLADFLQISFFSPNCFDITTVSMVFTHKIKSYTSQARLCVWSSSISGFVTYMASFEEILVNDKLFGEIPWLNLKIEFMHIYGSLPRPPDVRSIVVCMYFLVLLSRLDTSTLDVDCDVFWRYLRHKNALREGELRLEGVKLFLEFGIDGCMPLELLFGEMFIKMMMASPRWREIGSLKCDMLNGLWTTEVLVQIQKYDDVCSLEISNTEVT